MLPGWGAQDEDEAALLSRSRQDCLRRVVFVFCGMCGDTDIVVIVFGFPREEWQEPDRAMDGGSGRLFDRYGR